MTSPTISSTPTSARATRPSRTMASTERRSASTAADATSWAEHPQRSSGPRSCLTKAFALSESEAPMTVQSVQSDAAEAVTRFATAFEQADVRHELDRLCSEWWGSRLQY